LFRLCLSLSWEYLEKSKHKLYTSISI
jgi:hypothetical protein